MTRRAGCDSRRSVSTGCARTTSGYSRPGDDAPGTLLRRRRRGEVDLLARTTAPRSCQLRLQALDVSLSGGDQGGEAVDLGGRQLSTVLAGVVDRVAEPLGRAVGALSGAEQLET